MTDGGGAQQPTMDLAAILQQLAAGMPAPAPPPPPQPAAAAPQPTLDAILGAQAILSTPMYQNLARMLMMNQMNQMLQHQQPVQNNPLLAHHMSLKRTLPAPIPTMEHLRKRSAPVPPPPPPRSPTPPLKKWIQNLTPEQKAKNEMFNREIMKRLDVILLEELGDDEEMEEDQDQEEKMGSAGSAFRRILSRTDDDTPSIGSLSSGPNSPPIEVEPLSQESVDMLVELGKKHREEKEEVEMNMDEEEGFEKWYPISWTGNIVMKSSEVPLNLHLVSGSREYLHAVLGDATHPQRNEIRINQRLRLETGIPHLYKLLTGDDFCCCIGVPAGMDREQVNKSADILETAFIDYLNAKGIAGIGLLPPISTEKQDQPSRVHIFAPNEIVTRYMNQLAPNLYEHLNRRELRYVLFIFGTNDATTVSSTTSENVNATS